MDFMKLLKSLEEALYEVMVWLVFYPLTFWLVLTRPSAMMAYADAELDDPDEDRYSDKLSPPIFLAITLGLSHLFELGSGHAAETGEFLANDQNLLAFRMIVFSLYPLVLAVRLLRRKGLKLDRKALRGPFYSQCFVAAPFALVVGSAPLLAAAINGTSTESFLGALAAIGVALVWYLAIQAKWFASRLGISLARGLWNAVLTWFEATILVVLLANLVAKL